MFSCPRLRSLRERRRGRLFTDSLGRSSIAPRRYLARHKRRTPGNQDRSRWTSEPV